MHPPRPKAFVLAVLGAVGDVAVPVAALLEGAVIFDITAGSLRVALARLRREGLVTSDARGEYRLGDRALNLATQIASWRDAGSRVVPWDGTWVVVHTGGLPRADRAIVRTRERALRLLGLREWHPGLHLRPNNLADGVDGLRERLERLGMDAGAPVFVGDALPMEGGLAESLWETAALEHAYSSCAAALDQSAAAVEQQPLEDAAREAYLLGSDAIRRIVYDPLLPDAIVDVDARAAFFAAMRSYDQVGRRLWRRVLGVRRDEAVRSPADLGSGAHLALTVATTP